MAQNIFITFLQALSVKHTVTYANRLFEEHPYRYSLLGLSELLEAYHIPNVGIRVKDKDVLRLNIPFVAHVSDDFAIVDKITENIVGYNWRGHYLNSNIEEFKKSWDGIALIAEPQENSVEPELQINKRNEFINQSFHNIFYSLIIFSFVVAGWNNHIGQSLNSILLLICSVFGLQVSYFLLQKQMKNQSEYADKLCTLFHQKDCNDILETSAAKIGPFSWSEIGFGYFASNIVLIACFPELVHFLALINICALPYTIWSIWYQAQKIKQWCMLCVMVQILLWGLFALNILFQNILIPELVVSQFVTVLLIYTIPALAVSTWTKMNVKMEKIVSINQELISLKGNNDVFMALLKKEKYYPVKEETSQIIFGNPQAPIKITVLTNPHCEPCGRMHKRIEALLEKKGDSLCVQYVFSAFNEDLLKSNRFLIAAYLQSTLKESKRVYTHWYEKGKYHPEICFGQFPFRIDDEVEVELQRHEQWKKENGLRATPTILVNGYRLPKQYNIEDLQYQADITI